MEGVDDMNQRTYELIAKWCAEKNGVKVVFDPKCDCPVANIKDNTITLPPSIKKENAYGALALVIHEAAHLKYTTELPHPFTDKEIEHNILNAIEDARIDRKNFLKLPNIKDFYGKFLEENKKDWDKKDLSKVPLINRVLCQAILNCEDMRKYSFKDDEAKNFDNTHGITNMVWKGMHALDIKDWDRAKEIIKEIIGKFNLPKEQEEKQAVQPVPGKPNGEIGNIEDMLRGDAAKLFSHGQEDGTSTSKVGLVAVSERTKHQFKEILNITTNQRIEDGTDLNTDNLTAFATGDIAELFEDEKVVKKRKSKIHFLLDASGSMEQKLLDGETRIAVVAGAVKELTKVLDEVRAVEGLNVGYNVNAFSRAHHELNQNDWIKSYMDCFGGGTDLVYPFGKEQEILMKDIEADGKKVIIVFTDGDVHPSQVKQIKELVLEHNQDIRVMIVGVGSSPTHDFVEEFIGDHNILTKDTADIVIMEAIMDCLM